MGIKIRISRAIEKWVPERRLFLRTDTETRFVRLSSGVQIGSWCVIALFVGWSIVATAIVLMDSIGSGNFRDQARRDQLIYEDRLNALATERDVRAEEALAAQERFNTALAQVSLMQTELLNSEDGRKELERGLEVMQRKLRSGLVERETLRTEIASLQATLGQNGSLAKAADAAQNNADSVAYLAETLTDLSGQRDFAISRALTAQDELAKADDQLFALQEKNDLIFRQLEDAMTISVEPLDKMFRKAGLSTNSLLTSVRKGYSGQGGALSPITFSTRGANTVDPDADRANSILDQLDKLNMYRIAAQKAPFAVPVKDNFRYTSGFGPRWGRMHRGADFAAPHGTDIFSTADGVVTKAEWGSGYGRVVYIQHEFGIETRYAHLAKIRVKKGQRVKRGQHIGDMGSSGRSTGTHLHYEVRVNGNAVNPMTYIKAANDVF